LRMPLIDTKQFQQQMLAERTRQSTSFLSQAYSADGRWLAAGDATGRIAVWDVDSALKAAGMEEGTDATMEARSGAVLVFKAHAGSVYSLCTYEGLLVSAGGPEMHAWSWDALVGGEGGGGKGKGTTPTAVWTTYTADPQARTIEGPIEINDLAADTQAGNLLAAAGDGRVHIFNVKSLKKLGSLDTPAGGMLHCVNLLPSSRRCVTAGEDGAVRFWDMRSSATQPISIIDTGSSGGGGGGSSGGNSNSSSSGSSNGRGGKRNSISGGGGGGGGGLTTGKWVSCAQVNANEDWLLCGGGNGVSLWHLRSNQKTTTFKTSPNYYATNAHFTDTGVCAVGNNGTYSTWAMNGDVQLAVGVSCGVSFSAARCPTDDPALSGITTVAGNAPIIDIIASAGHKASVSLEI